MTTNSASKFDVLGSCSSKASQNKRKIQMEYNLLRFQHPSLNHHYKCIEGGSAYQEWNKKYVVKATSKPSFDSGLPTSNSKNMLESIKNFLAAFYWFCYPYSMIGQVSSNFYSITLLNNPLIFWLLLNVVHLY